MRAWWSSLPTTRKWSWLCGALAVLVCVYALLGLAWEPLLTADAHYRPRYPCDDAAPWVWVASVAWLGALIALVIGVVLLFVQRPRRTARALLVAAVSLLAAGVMVAGAYSKYDDGSCPPRPLAAGVEVQSPVRSNG